MKKKFDSDLIIGVVCLAVALLFLYASCTYPNLHRPEFGDYGADLLPKVTSYVMIFFSLMLILQSVLKRVRGKKKNPTGAAEAAAEPTPEEIQAAAAEKKEAKKDALRVVGIIVLSILYLLFVGKIGFLICTPILMLGSMALYGNKKWWVMVLVALVFTVAVDWIFVDILGVQLPRGIFQIF